MRLFRAKNHKFGEPGGKKLSIFRLCEQYLVQAYILHVWTAQSWSTAHDWITLFEVCIQWQQRFEITAGRRRALPNDDGNSPTVLAGIAKTRALPPESSCYSLKTSMLDHLFISIHSHLYSHMSEGFRM
eukprot:s168_g24.t1